MVDYDKAYVAEMTLGLATSTQDGGALKVTTNFRITPKRLADVIGQFRGRLSDPPMASAVQVEGRRLYELQRQGVTVERQHAALLSVISISTRYGMSTKIS